MPDLAILRFGDSAGVGQEETTAAWTLQQRREAIGFGDGYRYIIHDRDSIFAKYLDESIDSLGLKIMTSSSCLRNRCWAGFITSIRWRPHWPDPKPKSHWHEKLATLPPERQEQVPAAIKKYIKWKQRH